jgi:hypothetical protein
MVRMSRSTLSSYSRRQQRNLNRCTTAQIRTATPTSRIISSAPRFVIAVRGQSTNAIVTERSPHNAAITSAALSESVGFGRRDQNHTTRESSESPASTKSSFINSGNRKGGNSWYSQTGSVVRPLHIAKSQALRNSEFPFTACSLVPARSMFSHRFPRRLRRPLGQPGLHCPVFR